MAQRRDVHVEVYVSGKERFAGPESVRLSPRFHLTLLGWQKEELWEGRGGTVCLGEALNHWNFWRTDCKDLRFYTRSLPFVSGQWRIIAVIKVVKRQAQMNSWKGYSLHQKLWIRARRHRLHHWKRRCGERPKTRESM